MLFRLSHIDLTRRLVGYFVLFSTAALVWLAVSTTIAAWWSARSRADAYCRTQLDKASAILVTENLRLRGKELAGAATPAASSSMDELSAQQASAALTTSDPAAPRELQAHVERIQRESHVTYCAVVSTDGKILAHSSRELVGTTVAEPAAEYTQEGKIERLRFPAADTNRWLIEYRIPLRKGKREFAALHMAVTEPDFWEMIRPIDRYAPLLFVGPLLLMVIGSAALIWTIRPIAQVTGELNRLAVAITPAAIDLQAIRSAGPAGVGWNRIVEFFRQEKQTANVSQRIEQGLQALLGQQGNEVLNSLPEGLAITNREGRIDFANRALAAICQRCDGDVELAGQMIADCLPLTENEESAVELLEPGYRERSVVAEIAHGSNGSSQVLRVARHPLWRTDGEAGGNHIWSVRDVTQQKLAAKMRDQFLHTATHELRTPLANIRAYAETLDIQHDIDIQQQKQFLNTISSEATRLARLVDDLLNVSSMEVGSLSMSREETDIGRILEEVVDKVKAEIDRKQIQLETRYPAKWPKMHLDKDKVNTSLVNVLGNAVKYTPVGGRVTLHVLVQNDHLVIRVDDTGVGISADELPYIFDKFFRSSDQRVQEEVGSGLGLSLVKEVVRMHEGTIDVKSEPGAGTQFCITLPVR